MTTDEKIAKNFLGIPIHGDINPGDKRARQRPLEELEPFIRAVLDDPYIHSFGWEQGTPYFNDGDPCVFSVGDLWFRTVDDLEQWRVGEPRVDEDGDEVEEDEYDVESNFRVTSGSLEIKDWGDGHPSLGKREYDWVGDYPDRVKVYGPYEGEHEASYTACLALSDAIDSEEFDDVLLVAFGDNTRIVVKATGITVDEYSHD